MPIDWSVDEERHCLQARFFGALTWQEITDFQTNVSLTAPYLGYHGFLVIDRTTRFPAGSATDPVQLIAHRAAAYYSGTRTSRLAIVTETDAAFGIVRMFMAFFALAGGTRPIGLFRGANPRPTTGSSIPRTATTRERAIAPRGQRPAPWASA